VADTKWARVSLAVVLGERPADWPGEVFGEGRVGRTGDWSWNWDFWLTGSDPVELQLDRMADFLMSHGSQLAPYRDNMSARISWTPVGSQHCLSVTPHVMAALLGVGCLLSVDTYLDE